MRIDKNHWLKTRFIAHRGLWDESAPENTLLSYQKAIDSGFAIEIDVYETLDKEIVCLHDSNLLRLTGTNKFVWELTLKELKELFVLGSKEKIPTLEETLLLCENKTPLLIEIKNQKSKTLVKSVVNMLKEYKGEFAVQSFNPLFMKGVKRLAPEFLRGILASNSPDTDKWFERYTVKRMPLNFIVKPDFIAYEHTGLPLKNNKGLSVIAWTVRSKVEYEKVKLLCDNVIFENFIPEK